MRFAVLAAVCLSMVVCATANDVSVGDRQEGDVLAASRRLIRVSFRRALPFDRNCDSYSMFEINMKPVHETRVV